MEQALRDYLGRMSISPPSWCRRVQDARRVRSKAIVLLAVAPLCLTAALVFGCPAAGAAGAPVVSAPRPPSGRGETASTAPARRPNSALPFGTGADVVPAVSIGPITPVVGIAATPDGHGYWMVTAGGGVWNLGTARSYGSLAGRSLPAPIVAMASSGNGRGYWLLGANGSVYPFGNALPYGEASSLHLGEPIVGMAVTPDGHGYWLVGADGGVFAFGDARYQGRATNLAPSDPVVAIAPAHEGSGYWLVDATGDVLAFGSARLHGSAGSLHLGAPIVGMAATSDDGGYWLVGADGGVFAFGDAKFEGSSGGAIGAPVIGIAPAAADTGYWLATGAPPPFLNAIADYVATRDDNVTVGVYDIATGRTYAFRPDLSEYTASTVKVDILATLLHQTQSQGPLPPNLQALAVPMIEDSLDSAADTLWDQLGPAAIGAFDREAGLTATFPPPAAWWATTPTTVEDRLALLRTVVFPNSLLNSASRAYMLYLMEHVTPLQDWGATGGVPAGVTVALKNGFALVAGWQMDTTGWVDGEGRDYLIAVMTNGNATESYGITTVNTISSIIWPAL
jgi:hypothetical protein